jgi:hypothetical protein
MRYAGKALDIPVLTTKARSDCGISWEPPRITNPQDAMVAYLEAVSAFPDIDDFVICFQYRSDAIRVQDALRFV